LERQKQVNSQNLDVNQSKLQYENSKVEEERQKKLFDEGVISQQEYQNFKVDMDVKQTTYQNAQILSGNNLKQFTADVDIRKQELEAAINNLSLLREGATKNSRQVSNVVTSTVSGMILELPVEEGSSVIERNTFNEGTSIATIADMTSLIFEGKVDESDVGKLTEGMPLVLTVGAIVDEKFDALLEYISPKGLVEEGTVKFEIRADITPREDIFLRAGYSANADIILGKKEQVVTVNERDVIYSNDSTFVEVATGDQEFEKREVDLGLSDGIIVEVINGLDTITEIKMRQDENSEETDDEEN
jgi:HlyD family secretion protein